MTNKSSKPILKPTIEEPIAETVFRLRDLIKPDIGLWLMSWVFGLFTSLSIIGLLIASGWFLSITAIAGVLTVSQAGYSLPSLLIRIFAFTRTIGRYAELVVAHDAIFSLLRDLRVRFFGILANQPLTHQRQSLQASGKMHRLVTDINALNEFNLRIVLPWLTALVVVGTIITATILLVIYSNTDGSTTGVMANLITGLASAEQLDVVSRLTITESIALILILLMLCLIIPTVMAVRSVSYNRGIAVLAESRRNALLSPLTIITQLLMWGQWHNQTQDFINYDNCLHRTHWQTEKQKGNVLLLVQWLMSAVVLLILLILTALFMQIGINDTGMLWLGIGLALLLGIFGLQGVLLPLAQHYLSYGKARIAKERLNDMLTSDNTSDKTKQEKSLNPLPKADLEMTLIAVSAKLPNAIIGANNVSFKVTAGTPMILSGASGCGKSTLLQTLANELAMQSGELQLNKQPWHSYDWSDQLGYLGQQLDIFDQTLADNLRLGKADASDKELMDVLDKVALTDWLTSQPQGLQTRLGEYGTAVSGGQARRIALARLLLKPRTVLLLDEPFAGLDKTSQRNLWQAITAHQKQGLLIVVSHHQTWQDIGKVERYHINT